MHTTSQVPGFIIDVIPFQALSLPSCFGYVFSLAHHPKNGNPFFHFFPENHKAAIDTQSAIYFRKYFPQSLVTPLTLYAFTPYYGYIGVTFRY